MTSLAVPPYQINREARVCSILRCCSYNESLEGTSLEKLYLDLGWESLSLRRWSRRLTFFYEVINSLTPDYTRNPLLALQQVQYSRREPNTVGQIQARTEQYKSSFYPHCLSKWKKLDPEVRLSHSVAVFKTNIPSITRSLQNMYFGFVNRRASCLIPLNSELISAS